MGTRDGSGIHVRITKIDISESAMERIKKLLRGAPARISRHRAMIGLQEQEGGEPKVDYDGKPGVRTLAQAMIEHEYGTDVLPERSFLRNWFDANVDRLADGMKAAMRAEFEGDKDAVRAWVQAVADEWKKWIAAGGDFTGLMPSTIREKKAAGLREPETPLVATQQFVDAWRGKLDGVGV